MNKKMISAITAITCALNMLVPSLSVSAAEESNASKDDNQQIITDNPQEIIHNEGENITSEFVSDGAISSYDKNYKLTTSGKINNLVVFIRFSDQVESTVYKSINSSGNGSISEIKNAFNGSSYSLKDYTDEISSGKFSVTSEFYPQNSSGNAITYKDSHPLSYYQSTTDSSKRKTELMLNALDSIASQVKNKSKFDYNKDGILDYVTFVVPNMGEWGEALWPTCLTYYSPINIDKLGLKMRKAVFITTPYFKYYGKSASMYKVLSHESMHMIGMNDLYANKTPEPVGNWTVMMQNNGHPTVYEKSAYGKWVTNVKSASKSGNYTVANTTKNSTSNVTGYKISLAGSKSYYMLEYRNKNASIYEKDIKASGLLCYKVNESSEGNLNGTPYEVEVIKPSAGTVLNSTSGQYKLALTGTSGKVEYIVKVNSITKDNIKFTVKASNDNKTLAITKITPSKASPQNVNTSIKLTTTATGGTGTLQYKYTLICGSKKLTSAISKNNYYNWKPTVAGKWSIKVEVKDSKGIVKSKTISYTINKVNSINITSLTSSVKSPQFVNTSIKIATKANGGSGTLQYKYTLTCGSKSISTAYSTNSVYTWKPTVAGTWTIKVQVKDSKGTVKSKTLTYTIKSKPTFKVASLVASVKSPQYSGTKITLNAKATGGSGTIQYKYLIKCGDIKLTTDYDTKGSVVWSAGTVGNWTITVFAKDSTGTCVSKTISYVINQKITPLKITNINVPANITSGSTYYDFTATATGTGKLEYKFTFSRTDFTMDSEYSTSNGISAKFGTKGYWTVKVEVKDSTGKVVSKTRLFKVN